MHPLCREGLLEAAADEGRGGPGRCNAAVQVLSQAVYQATAGLLSSIFQLRGTTFSLTRGGLPALLYALDYSRTGSHGRVCLSSGVSAAIEQVEEAEKEK